MRSTSLLAIPEAGTSTRFPAAAAWDKPRSKNKKAAFFRKPLYIRQGRHGGVPNLKSK